MKVKANNIKSFFFARLQNDESGAVFMITVKKLF